MTCVALGGGWFTIREAESPDNAVFPKALRREEGMIRKERGLVERVDAANDVLARAFEGGFFEPWLRNVWRRADRDACRAAAREMIGDLGADLKIRLDVKARDVYRDQPSLPEGDWDKVQDAQLVSVHVAAPRTGSTPDEER